jgi:hypothetical protein
VKLNEKGNVDYCVTVRRGLQLDEPDLAVTVTGDRAELEGCVTGHDALGQLGGPGTGSLDAEGDHLGLVVR